MSERHLTPRLLNAGDLSAGERRDLLAHVRICAACRAHWLGGDASRIFALLALETSAPGDLDRLSSRVSSAIDREGSPAAGRRRRWASVAAAFALAGLLGSYFWNGTAVRPRDPLVPDDLPRAEASIGGFELLSSPGTAEVHDLMVGDTHLVMIFDEALDL